MIHFLFTHLIHPMHSLPRAEQKHADFFSFFSACCYCKLFCMCPYMLFQFHIKLNCRYFMGYISNISRTDSLSQVTLYILFTNKVHVLTNILNQFLIITHIFDNFIHLSFFNFCPGCNCRSFRTITNSTTISII